MVEPSPWYAAECLVLLARATLRVTGPADARALLVQAAGPLRCIQDAPALERWLASAGAEADAAAGSPGGSEWGLTPSEMRVLRYLPSHLSFREIADRLVVSPNTVKTHARGIYRKLGVTSRATAVESAERAGLVGRAPGD